MRPTDCAYISAVIDSKGCVKIEPPKKGEMSCLNVWVTDKNFKLMEYLQRNGAWVIQLPDGQFRAKWRDQRALNLLRSIISFSIMKKEQMQVSIEFMEAKTSEQKEQDFDISYRLRLKMLKKTEE